MCCGCIRVLFKIIIMIHVEIVQRPESVVHKDGIVKMVQVFLQTLGAFRPGAKFTKANFDNQPALKNEVLSFNVCDLGQSSANVDFAHVEHLKYHVHVLGQINGEIECMDDEDSELPAANMWPLPAADFYGLWESLVYDSKVKEDTIRFVETTLLLSDRGVDPNVINFNRVILLHGPPGTGKTSLCKALAQKLSIRLSDRYQRGHLIEINSHSLFSKWFSESGKLVMKLFNKIREIVADSNAFVCVLIDEVESLTHARKASMSGVEPSDSIRVVNAMLTQIDHMKQYPNVIIMTTSNVTEAIDLAFVDRADIKQYIGLPSETAVYQIYRSCIEELMNAAIITPKQQIFSFHLLQSCHFDESDATIPSLKLLNVAKLSIGLSGRTLRKIPFLTLALFVSGNTISLPKFLDAMAKTVNKQMADNEIFTEGLAVSLEKKLKIEN